MGEFDPLPHDLHIVSRRIAEQVEINHGRSRQFACRQSDTPRDIGLATTAPIVTA